MTGELTLGVAAVLAAAETLAGDSSASPEERQAFMSILTRHSKRLSELTSDLLELSRIQGGGRLHAEPIDPRCSCHTPAIQSGWRISGHDVRELPARRSASWRARAST